MVVSPYGYQFRRHPQRAGHGPHKFSRYDRAPLQGMVVLFNSFVAYLWL